VSKDKDQTEKKFTVTGALRTAMLGAGLLAAVGLALGIYGVKNYLGQVAFHHGEVEHLYQLRSDVKLRERQLLQATELLPAFERLQQRGVIGALGKTLEADRFEKTAAGHPANVRSFAMGALDPIAAPADLTFSALQLGRHELTFTAHPRHEVHLLRLLSELSSELGGLSLLRSCDLTRSLGVERGAQQNEDGSAVAAQGEIRARCAIDWYVFSPATENLYTDSLPASNSDAYFDEAAR